MLIYIGDGIRDSLFKSRELIEDSVTEKISATESSVNAYPKPADSKYCKFFLYCRTTHYISLQMLTFSAPNFCSFSQRLDTAILKVSINFLTFASVPRRTKVTSGHQRKDNYCEVQICCFATLLARIMDIFQLIFTANLVKCRFKHFS